MSARDPNGLTGDGLSALRSLRRQLLRALLVLDAQGGSSDRPATLSTDYIVWSQLRQELADDSHERTGAVSVASIWSSSHDCWDPSSLTQSLLQDCPAHRIWQDARRVLATNPAFTEANTARSLALYLDETPAFKALAGAVLAGLALLRSLNFGGWSVAAHDELARRAGGTDSAIRDCLWQPDALFFSLFSGVKQRELAQPFVHPDAFPSWRSLKGETLSGAVAGALDPASHTDPVLAERAAGWVHPVLSFEDNTA